ncbi:hypothetical protein Sme01_38170 [Sphaerisporangium melleum]|uniref:Uncharacterized protein n=1 Tax=Sphaerisporangium melleum TaxID=321316 RepID=A0A917R1S9_9ACTN|nr:hypothetical protein GCM10007964_26320 [Sphaerisporangium melleum]GII71341.1 hypothetical protein Sme01_38170 [Sphaerisporangium melleum]
MPLGQVVFLPGPLRVTGHDAGPGDPANGRVLHGTGAIPVVSVQLDPSIARRSARATGFASSCPTAARAGEGSRR